MREGENHLSEQPVPETWLSPWSGQLRGLLFGLAPDGVFPASSIALGAVGSYPAFSPLPPSHRLRRRYVFCGTVRRKAFQLSSRVYLNPHGLELRGIAPCGVRTFLPGLAPEAILRPSKIISRIHEAGSFARTAPPVGPARAHLVTVLNLRSKVDPSGDCAGLHRGR